MTTAIVKFLDDEGNECFGILVDDTNIICSCCGGVIPVEEATIIETYDFWVDFSEPLRETIEEE